AARCRIWLYGIKARRRRRRAVGLRWRHLGLPGTPACRSAHGRAPGARLRRAAETAPPPTARRTREQPGDEHQAETIAGLAGLVELVMAIDARRRSAPPASAAHA